MRFIGILTFLRFPAAAAVVLFHAAGLYDIPKTVKVAGIANLMSFFFVLSGFIIAYSYPRIEDAAARRKFYIARITRVWPLHLLATLLALIIIPTSTLFARQPELWQQITSVFMQLTLTHTWIPAPWANNAFNNVSWSISVEVLFYLIFPWMILGWRQKWPYYLIGAFLIIPALMLIGNHFDIRHYSRLNPEVISTAAFFHVTPYSRFIEFFLGMGIALLCERRGQGFGLSWSKTAWTLAEIGVVVLFCSHMALVGQTTAWVHANFGDVVDHWYKNSSALPTAALIVLVFSQAQGAISEFFGKGFWVLMGDSTYSLYLLHGLMIDLLDRIGGNPLGFLAWPLQFTVVLAGFTVISIFSYKYFEMPARRWLTVRINKLWPQPSVPSPQAPAAAVGELRKGASG